MEEILKLAGFKKTKWMPHCVTNIDKPKYRIKELENSCLQEITKPFMSVVIIQVKIKD